MTDVFDRASELEEVQRADALAAQRFKAGLGDAACWRELSAASCAGCGARIPDERRKLLPGVQLCVECQADTETLGKRGGNRWGA
ncbi:MAG: transcriptional regulator, TraR/DksA family [Rhodocyclales bacterium]|nr:transcriptional regulator, TraR/DksA family [Rhodocyclales bacterium]